MIVYQRLHSKECTAQVTQERLHSLWYAFEKVSGPRCLSSKLAQKNCFALRAKGCLDVHLKSHNNYATTIFDKKHYLGSTCRFRIYIYTCVFVSLSLYICIYTYMMKWTYQCIKIRRPLPERERASLHCHQPIPSHPAESNQPLLQYLAISHPAVCNLAVLQNAPCLIASS